MTVANIGEGSDAQASRDLARKGSVVFVVDRHKRPLMPCPEKRARRLLHRRRAVIHRRYLFTIRRKERVGGEVGSVVARLCPTLEVTACGRGSYQRTRAGAYGFPRLLPGSTKLVAGFQTGDMVRAVVPGRKKAGIHVGRVAARISRSFNISTGGKTIQGVNARWCKRTAPADGIKNAVATDSPSSLRPKTGVSGEAV